MNKHASHRRSGFDRVLATAVWAGLAAFGGCGSAPTTNYYTLMPPAAANDQATAATPVDWDVLSVTVPAQVDQPQWVVRTADGSVTILEQERWIAPLADEIRGVVVERLTKSFGPPRMTTNSAGAAPSWRIRIDVRRFDLVLNHEARLEADWSMRGGSASVTCHTNISQPMKTPDFAGLARGQQQAVAELATAIGVTLRAAEKGQAIAC